MKKANLFLLSVFGLALFMSCQRPYDVPEFVEIKANETAFIVPLTGNTTEQGQFMSEEYLRKNMVATKRVQIPHEWVKTGKGSSQGEYKDTVAVIIVDRTPVSVTWNVTPPNTRIGVESKESVGFTLPISMTVMIEEQNTPKFLNKYSAQSLRNVVDTDVNAFIKTETSKSFGVLTLEECKSQKQKLLDDTFAKAKVFFAQYGITISQFGMTDGFIYDDDKYQQAVNKKVVLEAEGKNLDEAEKNAVKQRGIDYRNAQNEADIAARKASAVVSLKALQEVENSRILAEAQAKSLMIMAEKGIDLPEIMPESAFYNLGLDKYIPSAKK